VTRPIYVGQYEEVRLVNLYATVRDRKGASVLSLTRDDFTILEDGVPQVLTHFTSAKVPLTIVLLIDASNSMNLGGKIELARKAAVEFAESVDAEDRLMVLSFNDDLQGLTAASADRKAIKTAIEAIQARGGTALYDAIYRAADRLAGRRAGASRCSCPTAATRPSPTTSPAACTCSRRPWRRRTAPRSPSTPSVSDATSTPSSICATSAA